MKGAISIASAVLAGALLFGAPVAAQQMTAAPYPEPLGPAVAYVNQHGFPIGPDGSIVTTTKPQGAVVNNALGIPIDSATGAMVISDTTYNCVAALKNAICSSAMDGAGNPFFLSGSGATITINGANRPGLVYRVGGMAQKLTANISVTVPTPAVETEYFIFVKQDAAGAPTAADLVATSSAPFVQPAPPTCPSPTPALSATNPSYWYDTSNDAMMVCTTNGGSYSAASPPALLLGVAAVSAIPSVDGVAAMPFSINPEGVYNTFGQGANGVLSITSGTTTLDGSYGYRAVMISAGTVKHSANSSTGLAISSQTPVLLVNSGSINLNGLGAPGATGSAGAGAAGTAGVYGGAGGGSGGAGSLNAGAAGGTHEKYMQTGFGSGAGAAGAIATSGGAGEAAATGALASLYGICNLGQGKGGSGAAGAGDGSNTGGNGGAGGGDLCLDAPSIQITAGASISCNGGNGANAGGGNAAGGGGGGGGSCLLFAGFVSNSGTFTAAGGTHGSGAGTGAAGGNGGTGTALIENSCADGCAIVAEAQ